MQNNFQIISDYLYTITKNVIVQPYVKFNPHSVLGFLLIASPIIFFASLLLLGAAHFFKWKVSIYFAPILWTLMFGTLFSGSLSFIFAVSTAPYAMTVEHPKLVQNDTRKLTEIYKDTVYVNLNDDRHNYLYFTNDENKANDIKNNLSSNGTSVTLNSNSEDTLVCLNYGTDNPSKPLKSYKFIKTSVQLNGSNNNSVKVYSTDKMPIKKIIANSTSVKSTDSNDNAGQDVLNTWFILHMLRH